MTWLVVQPSRCSTQPLRAARKEWTWSESIVQRSLKRCEPEDQGTYLYHYLAEQFFRPVSAMLAMSHFPSVRIRLNKSVPQWSTLPSSTNSNGAHTTARS